MSKQVIHTLARGYDPYDKVYSLGYEVGHKDWSPFSRVNHLRKAFLDREYLIDNERFKNVTESYMANEDKPQIIKCALAFENILMKATLRIYDEDLILGEICAPAKASPQYPEFSINWMIYEALYEPFEKREHDQHYFANEDDRKEFVELCEYWKGKTVEDLANATIDDDMAKGSETGKKIFQTNLYHYAGVGHLVMDYPRILSEGYDGMIKCVEEKLEKLDLLDPDYGKKKEFYDAVLICHKAAKKYIARYEQLAREKAETEKDEKRKAELILMADNCKQIAGGPAKTYWQALQLFNFATTLTQIESNGHSISYGRMDQWLYPYLDADLKKGTITKEFAQELLEVTFVKMNNPTKLRDGGTAKVRQGRGFGGECLTIGGLDKNGNDVTNDLTMMMLDASVHTRMMCPWLLVRMSDKTPYEVKVKAVECIRAGYGHPKIFNDKPTIEAMIRKGISKEEAPDYAVVGCVEPTLPGKEYGWHDSAYINTAKFMEMVLNGGICLDCSESCPRYDKCVGAGKRLGPNTGNLAEYKNMDELLLSVKKQFKYWLDEMCASLNIIDRAHQERKPLPYLSAFFIDCLEKGKDITAGGAKYNGIGPQALGVATCSDTLTTIKQLVFDEKKYTGAELLQAIKDNWQGHEVLYNLINSSKVHHYGNDDDYADDLFKYIYDTYCDTMANRPITRGGFFSPGVYSVSGNVAMGLGTNATLDGRMKGEAISDNMGPVHTKAGSHDTMGPTALSNSVGKVDHSKATNGTLLNVRFPENAVSGIEGRDNLISYIDSYLSNDPMHIQFNIMSAETMKQAQKNPEEYKDMLVRVAGYSAYFVELGEALQTDLIQRTELHF